MSIPFASAEIPFVDTSQMREVDRVMMQDYKIELIQMMENAGRNLAHLARVRFLNMDPVNKRVTILAGTGGNGGGALVSARRLHNWGAQVQVLATRADKAFSPAASHQLDILNRMEIPILRAEQVDQVAPSDLIIDGLIGYSLLGAPRGAAAILTEWANRQAAPILALDVPSGLDTTTGTAYAPVIQATATMTLALPKVGLRSPDAKPYVGELYLADISIPPALYREPALGLTVGPLFAESELIRLW